MKLTVRTLEGQSVEIELEGPSGKLSLPDLKRALEEEGGFPAHAQRLLLDGAEITEDGQVGGRKDKAISLFVS